jgi:cystathionine beta-synthase
MEIHPYATEGVGEDILAANMHFDLVDDFVRVNDATSLQTARRLAREEGLFVGGSCGLAMAGALQWIEAHQSELTERDVVVVLLPDSGFRYLSKLYDDAWMKDRGFLRPAVALTAGQVLRTRSFPHPVISVDPGETLSEAINRMASHSISQVPVMDTSGVVGSLAEARILALLIEEPAASARPVRDVMDLPFPIVGADSCLDDVVSALERGLDAVLVENAETGGLEILTKSDLIRALAARSSS